MKKAALITLSILLLVPQASAQEKTDLNNNQVVLKLSGLQSTKGKVMCALHKEKGWLKDRYKQSVVKIKADKTAECFFAQVPAGTYAVAAFHDENGDGELETNFIGIPQEGVAMSNVKKMGMGPPDFDEAKFSYKGGKKTLKSPMIY